MILRNYLRRLVYTQLFLFVVTWFLGIYINGFVSGQTVYGISFLRVHVVTAHFIFGIAILTIAGILFSVALKYKLRRATLFSGLALAGVAIAATGGLSFVFGIGNQNIDSMLMATSFITALYLSFLSVLNPIPKFNVKSNLIRLSFAVLVFFYIAFLSGMYANIFVASEVFSEPPSIARKMLGSMVLSPSMLFHEITGTLLFALVIVFTILLYRAHLKLAVRGAISAVLVGYSFFEGISMNVLPIFEQPNAISNQNFIFSTAAPLVSAVGFLCAAVICLSVLESLTRSGQARQITDV